MVEIKNDITEEQLGALGANLKKSRLELLDDKRNILVEKLKNVFVEMIHYEDEVSKVNDSDYFSEPHELEISHR